MITIRQTGMAEISTMLSTLAAAAENISPAFPEMEAAFRQMETAAFLSEGASSGAGSWRPLSARYAAWKRSRFPGKTIGRLSEQLFHSLVRRGPGSYVETSTRRLVMGTSVPYAGHVQAVRPVISITNKQAATFTAILHRYFNRRIRTSLGRRAQPAAAA